MMIKVFLFSIFLFSMNLSHAQNGMGYIKYNAEVIPLDSTEENLQAVTLFRDSKIEIFFNGGKYRIDFQSGEFSRTTTIGDKENNMYMMLADNGATKIGQKFVLDSLPKVQVLDSNVVVKEYRDSTRKIIGFQCYYVEMNKFGKMSSYWCTDELKIKFFGRSMVDENLPGFPLMIQKQEMGFVFKYTASHYLDYLSDVSMFISEIPEGYHVVPGTPNR